MCLVFAMLGSAQDIQVVVSSLICEIIQGGMMNVVVDKLDAMTFTYIFHCLFRFQSIIRRQVGIIHRLIVEKIGSFVMEMEMQLVAETITVSN